MKEIARITLHRENTYSLGKDKDSGEKRGTSETMEATLTYEVADQINSVNDRRTSEFSQMAQALLQALGGSSPDYELP